MSDFSAGTDISTKIDRLERAFETLTGVLGKAGVLPTDAKPRDFYHPRPPGRPKPQASPRKRGHAEKSTREPERALSSLSTSAGSTTTASSASALERPHDFRSPRRPCRQPTVHKRDWAHAELRAAKLERARFVAEEQALQALHELGEAPQREARRLVSSALLPGALGEPKREAGRLVSAAEARAEEYRRLAAEWEHRAHEARRVQRAVDSELATDASSQGLEPDDRDHGRRDRRRERSRPRDRDRERAAEGRRDDWSDLSDGPLRGTGMAVPAPVKPVAGPRPLRPLRPQPPRSAQPKHLIDHVTDLIAPPPDVYLTPDPPPEPKVTPDQLPAAGIESERTDERADGHSPSTVVPPPRRAHSAPRLRPQGATYDKERIQGNRWHREAKESGNWLPTGRPPSQHSSYVDPLREDVCGLVDEPDDPYGIVPARCVHERSASRSGSLPLTPSMDALHRTAAELGKPVDTSLQESPRGRHSRYPPTSHRPEACGRPCHSPSGSSIGRSRSHEGLLWVPPNLRLSHRDSQLSAAYGRSLARGQPGRWQPDRTHFVRARSRTPSRPSTSDYNGAFVSL